MIQVLHRAFDIIELIARDPNRSFGLSEIADELGLNHATCANIIKTMVDRKYLEQVGAKKGYKLGILVYQLVGEHSYEDTLRKVSGGIIETMTAKLNETSLIAILRKNFRVIVHQAQAERDLMVRSSIEKNAYDSASGRVLIASLSDEQLDDFISCYGLPGKDSWKEASTEKGFFKEISGIRNTELAQQITASHVYGLAVPVKKGEQVVAALSVYLPESRATSAKEKTIVQELRESALKISSKLSQ